MVGYRSIAFILLMTVSVLAMLFDNLPVLISAIVSAFIWNFFFIPPTFTFHIDSTENLLMFFSYIVVALVNTVLSFKIRSEEKKARDKEEKENTIRLYTTLLNSLSHELRTPIATIIGAVDTLKENRERLSFSDQNVLLDQMDEASLRLNRQVNNLLNMSRLETGMLRLSLDWCDCNDLVYSVKQKLDTDQFHKFDFLADEKLPLFKLDRGIMEQVLYNLLHNAVQYTPANTIITIRVFQENGDCVFEISDNEPGIPEFEMQRVFEKFYRLPNSQVGGSGLGLSIVKGFVEAHYGTVNIDKNEKCGLKFKVKIPAEASYINNLKNESVF